MVNGARYAVNISRTVTIKSYVKNNLVTYND